MNLDTLAIYLNNHLAGAITATELVKRAASDSRGTDTRAWLDNFLPELEEDRETVRRLLRETGKREEAMKKLGAMALEKLTEARLSDLAGDSLHLRLVVELEALLIGTRGRIGMWRLLELFRQEDHRIPAVDFRALRLRAERQALELERLWQANAAVAFTG